ncbi:hypothetical protein BP5796_02224 [Coleophoma crateriformis]|uniref:Uncharacterized protein n=1 Tax=Coleophoma crateriformis TaxID=565419 RepID=A0A3D8SXS1_9HELO|nr:hypothetical protein BP5796_02224 [Coleophoma crateriformis]
MIPWEPAPIGAPMLTLNMGESRSYHTRAIQNPHPRKVVWTSAGNLPVRPFESLLGRKLPYSVTHDTRTKVLPSLQQQRSLAYVCGIKPAPKVGRGDDADGVIRDVAGPWSERPWF